MSEDFRAEVDAIREQLLALIARVDALSASAAPAPPRERTGGGQGDPPAPRRAPFPGREALWRATEHLAQRATERGVRGIVAFSGSYTDADEREYRWNRDKSSDDLLAQDAEAVARVLAALGHRQRVSLLKAVLEQPATAVELIDQLGLTSTGQAYHHLNTLQAAGLIRQGERGRFEFVGHQAPAFLILLAGVWCMLGTEHGTGTWEGSAAPGDPAGATTAGG